MTTPPPLTNGYRANFETIARAFENGDAALVSAIRKSDQQPVALICAITTLPGDGYDFRVVPLAEMCTGDPYEQYEDPTNGHIHTHQP